MMNGVSIIAPLTIDCIFTGVDRFPRDGEEIYSKDLKITLGGGANISACRLNNWNIPVKFGTFHSDGMLSKLALRECEAKNFPRIYNLYKGDKEPVILSVVYTGEKNRRIISYDPNVKENYLTDCELYDFLKDSRIATAPHNLNVVKKLHSDGTKLVYDVHCDDKLTLKAQRDILEYVDVFTPNAAEAMSIAKTSNHQRALEILCDYTAMPIVKLGEDGCCAKINGEILYFVAPKVDCIDTTGAGDNFLAGLIYGLYNGEKIEKCIAYANKAGAYSTTSYGCLGTDYKLD